MVDPVPEDEGYTLARFSFSKAAVNGRRVLRISYLSVRAHMDWPFSDEGESDLDRFVAAFDRITEAAREEIRVRDQLRDLDSEISELLSHEDDEK